MIAPPLFSATSPEGEEQMCEGCGLQVVATVDGLRVLGWLAYDGTSWTSQPLKVRRCQSCRSARTEDPLPALRQGSLF